MLKYSLEMSLRFLNAAPRRPLLRLRIYSLHWTFYYTLSKKNNIWVHQLNVCLPVNLNRHHFPGKEIGQNTSRTCWTPATEGQACQRKSRTDRIVEPLEGGCGAWAGVIEPFPRTYNTLCLRKVIYLLHTHLSLSLCGKGHCQSNHYLDRSHACILELNSAQTVKCFNCFSCKVCVMLCINGFVTFQGSQGALQAICSARLHLSASINCTAKFHNHKVLWNVLFNSEDD